MAFVAPLGQAATLTVTSNADSGSGTLRNALLQASAGDTIVFDLASGSNTISLTSATLTVSTAGGGVTIDGSNRSGAGHVTVDGAGSFAVFTVAANTTASMRNLTIQNGNSFGDGGGVYNNGTLRIERCTLSNNFAGSHGGGVFNTGQLTIEHCLLSGNRAFVSGGGIYSGNSVGTSTSLIGSTLVSNSSSLGSGIYGSATVTNTTFSGNSCSVPAGVGSTQGSDIFVNGSATLINDTLASNSGACAGIYNAGALALSNNIFNDGCEFPAGFAPEDDGGNVDSGASCVGAASNSKTMATLDLGPLQNNGGPTETVLPGSGSAAINFVACNAANAEDQRGDLRPDPASRGLLLACDAGATEANSIPDEIFADGFDGLPSSG